MLRPVISYQSLALGASSAELALVVAAYSVLSLVAAVPVGRGIDRRGEPGFIVVGTLILAVVVVALAAADGLLVLAAGSAALGLGQLLVMIGTQTVIANGRDAQRRDGRFATFTLVTSVAQFAAPGVGGLLIAGVGSPHASTLQLGNAYVIAFVAVAVGVLAGATLVWRPGALSSRPQHFGPPVPGAVGEVLRVPGVRVALVVGFSVLSAADLLVAFLPAYGELHDLSPELVGGLIAVHGLASIVMRVFLTRLLRRFTRRAVLTICLLLAALSLGTVPFVAWLPGLFVLMLASGAGIGLCQPIAIGWVAAAVSPEVRGTAMSIRMAGNRLGQTAVPAGVAALAGAAGVAVAFVGPGVLLLLAGGLVFWSRADEPT